MRTATIYRINEKACTIEIAQTVENTDEGLHAAVLNTRTFTFDELLRQHKIFREHTEAYDTFRDRLNSALRIDRSIEVDTTDMTARFMAEYGENVFFRGYLRSIIELYDEERQQILNTNDIVILKLNRKKINVEVSEKIDTFMKSQFELLSSEAFFNCNINLEFFSIQLSRTIIAANDYTWGVFHESDNCLLTILAEIGQIVHREKWTVCECGFCHKLFLGNEGEVCCHLQICIDTQAEQKKKIYEDYSKEHSEIKKAYDSAIRHFFSELRRADIDKYHPDVYDKYDEEKKVRQADMDKLKKHLIRNGLPAKELIDRAEKYRAEMKAMFEEILDRYGDKQL